MNMSEHEAILSTIASFVTAYNAGNLEDLLNYYADDLIKVRQGAEPESKEELAGRLRRLFDRFDTEVEVNNSEIVVSGNIAYTRGSFRVTISPRDGGDKQQVTRRYLEIWRKRDGAWQVARTMDNAV